MTLSTAIREHVASLLREGRSTAAIALEAGVSKPSVLRIRRLLQPEPPTFVRSVHESMNDPEWRGRCMHARATDHACTEPATWFSGHWQVCDAHRRRTKARAIRMPQSIVA